MKINIIKNVNGGFVIMKKQYYMFRMDMTFLNSFSIILYVLSFGIFYLIYRDNTLNILKEVLDSFILVYIPYLIFHEFLHSLAYVLYGADFKNITYGAHLEKGVLCCLCKQNISKKNILFSLLYPFFFIGIVTLIIGIIIDNPLLIMLSLANISGCGGDLVMFYHLSRLHDFEFSEYDDPISFGLYSATDLSKRKMFGLIYVDTKKELQRNDLKKIVVSKTSIIILILFYLLIGLSFIID